METGGNDFPFSHNKTLTKYAFNKRYSSVEKSLNQSFTSNWLIFVIKLVLVDHFLIN